MPTILSLHIENFRSIKNCSIYFNDVTPIVGYNNAGKSNILKGVIGPTPKKVYSKPSGLDQILDEVTQINRSVLFAKLIAPGEIDVLPGYGRDGF